MKLPVLSGGELVKALAKAGFVVDHVTGSHVILLRATPPQARISVPLHKELAKGTLRAIMRQTGLTHEQLSELLQ
mgnify:CR=1 FL=1